MVDTFFGNILPRIGWEHEIGISNLLKESLTMFRIFSNIKQRCLHLRFLHLHWMEMFHLVYRERQLSFSRFVEQVNLLRDVDNHSARPHVQRSIITFFQANFRLESFGCWNEIFRFFVRSRLWLVSVTYVDRPACRRSSVERTSLR